MKKFISWIRGRDLKQYKESKSKRRDDYNPSSNPKYLGEGLKILDESIVDFNVSTTKYTRVLIILTVVLLFLTIVVAALTCIMAFRK